MSLREAVASLRLGSEEDRREALKRVARSGGVRALPILQAAAAKQSMPQLRELAGRYLERLRVAASEALRKYEGQPWPLPEAERDWGEVVANVVLAHAPDAAAFLAKQLGDHAAPFLRATAALGLGALRDPAGLQCLRRLLADPDSRIRTRAAEGLAYFEDGAADKTLSEAIAGDSTGRLARAAQFAREALGAEMVDPGPSSESGSEPSGGPSPEQPSVADEAAAAPGLANLIEEDQILFRLDSDAEQQQLEAARLLEGIGRDDALEPLYVLMTSRSEDVRRAASKAFGAIKSRT